MNKGVCEKDFKSVPELVALLSSRGLDIDVARLEAESYFLGVNYYRFTGYAIPFLESREKFREGSRFSDVRKLYWFDRKLRALASEALGVIEQTFRTNFARELAKQLGPLAYRESCAFRNDEYESALSMVMADYEHSVERCAHHFKFHKIDPPIWALVEVTTFGHLSKLFRALKNEYRAPIARCYGYESSKAVASLFQHLCVLRNRCAHHSRLYDLPWGQQDDPHDRRPDDNQVDKHRTYIFQMLPEWRQLEESKIEISRYYALFYQLALIYRFLVMTPKSAYDSKEWKERVILLLQELPCVSAMGVDLKSRLQIPEDIDHSPIWAFESYNH